MEQHKDIQEFKRLHQQAMDYAEKAFREQKQNNIKASIENFRRAFICEKEAFQFIENRKDCEPTRSIIARSVASLGFNSQEFKEAEKYIFHGLLGDPPFEIEEELRDLHQHINFSRHLELRGLEPMIDELQVSFSGNSVGHGMILAEDKSRQIQSLEKLFNRTNDRLNKTPFQKELKKKDYKVLESAGRAQSFALTLKLVKSTEASDIQTKLPHDPAIAIIDETLNCLELINNNNQEQLKEIIKDERYYENFIHLSKEIAPDGKKFSLVGFTKIQNGIERRLEFNRRRSEISILSSENTELTEIQEPNNTDQQIGSEKIFTGIMKEAKATKKGKLELESFKLEDPTNGHDSETLFIPESMNDIVQSYWKANVKVNAIFQILTKTGKKGNWLLKDIEYVES